MLMQRVLFLAFSPLFTLVFIYYLYKNGLDKGKKNHPQIQGRRC